MCVEYVKGTVRQKKWRYIVFSAIFGGLQRGYDNLSPNAMRNFYEARHNAQAK